MNRTESSQLIRRVLPTVLSSARLPLALAFPFVADNWRMILVIGAAASDALDGFTARRLGATTWWGGVLDAALDKLFTVTVLVVLCLEERIYPFELGLLLLRDVTVLAAILIAIGRGQASRIREASARIFGKATTVGLFTLFVVTLARPERGALQVTVLWCTIALSAAAAFDYIIEVGRALRRDSTQPNRGA